MGKALVVIDVQNDYFPDGDYPLWNAEATLANVERAIAAARDKRVPVIHVQHIADGAAPFFKRGSEGVKIHPRVLAAAPDAPVIVKAFADSFEGTDLEQTLTGLDANELLVCGMMTQNCVTHTAISRAADRYQVSVLIDCCTTVDETLHNLALHALSPRVNLTPASDAI